MEELESLVTMPKVVTLLSSLLQRAADSNDLVDQLLPKKVSVFHGLARPTISIQSYLERIFKYANCSPSCYVVAYVYLDRFSRRQPYFPVNSFSVHRLLITSVLVSAKFMDDIYYNNAYYAKVGGISTAEMNVLEVDFLFGLGFQLHVTPSTFHTYCSYLQNEMFVQAPRLLDPSLNTDKQLKNHCCFNEDESNHQKKQLAV
uniref:Cyclin n=1 Tax=Rhizophora mucronata TaxID=61149 RepID=A0A2P2P9D4_RHIMU